jgi:hypothetical protein
MSRAVNRVAQIVCGLGAFIAGTICAPAHAGIFSTRVVGSDVHYTLFVTHGPVNGFA